MDARSRVSGRVYGDERGGAGVLAVLLGVFLVLGLYIAARLTATEAVGDGLRRQGQRIAGASSLEVINRPGGARQPASGQRAGAENGEATAALLSADSTHHAGDDGRRLQSANNPDGLATDALRSEDDVANRRSIADRIADGYEDLVTSVEDGHEAVFDRLEEACGSSPAFNRGRCELGVGIGKGLTRVAGRAVDAVARVSGLIYSAATDASVRSAMANELSRFWESPLDNTMIAIGHAAENVADAAVATGKTCWSGDLTGCADSITVGAVSMLGGYKVLRFAGTLAKRVPRRRLRDRGLYQSVHPPPPRWLSEVFDDTVERVRRGDGVPGADPELVREFLEETYDHASDVSILVREVGGRARPIPRESPGAGPVRGVHDFGERVSVRRAEEFLARMRERPLRDRNGEVIPPPPWIEGMIAEAKRTGSNTIDVGKSDPCIASGLSVRGPPDPYALALHRMSGHHVDAKVNPVHLNQGPLIERIADEVNAMRQPRVYRKKPIPFDSEVELPPPGNRPPRSIREKLEWDLAAGRLPGSARTVVDDVIETQRRLEREHRINPYYLVEVE